MPENPFRREANKPLKSGGGSGTFDDMEQRVRVLEDKFIAIEFKLDRISDDLKALTEIVKNLASEMKKLNGEVMEIKGKLSNMPSTWQVIGICGSMIGFVVSGLSLAFVLTHFLHP